MSELLATRTPVNSTKTRLEKSISFMRLSVTVEEPHSMSALPVATAEKRVSTVTGTHSILSSGNLNCSWIDFTTCWQRSMV